MLGSLGLELPGRPVAHIYGIVAYYFGLLGFPGGWLGDYGTQRAQYGLIKEYTSDHIKDLYVL